MIRGINNFTMTNFFIQSYRNNLLQYKVSPKSFVYFVSHVNCDIFDNQYLLTFLRLNKATKV